MKTNIAYKTHQQKAPLFSYKNINIIRWNIIQWYIDINVFDLWKDLLVIYISLFS